jgi:hypothetical protein
MKDMTSNFSLKILLIAISCHAGAASAQSVAFIHGSWVNVREQADTGSRLLDQLHTNQSIDISERQGAWCKISYGTGKNGFVQCSFTGGQPLNLQQAAKEPGRAFWIAPSSKRLRDYGLSLKPPAHLTLEALQKTKKAGDVIQYPAVPEFEAAKKLMKAGVFLKPENEIQREIADLSKELAGLGLISPKAKPSLFKTQGSVVLTDENDADGFAAVTGSRLSVTKVGPPTVDHNRHNGPTIEWVNGFWDIGTANLDFSPALMVYSIASNGLIAADKISQTRMLGLDKDVSCGDSGLPFFSVNHLPWSKEDAYKNESVKGYPKLNDSQLVLVRLSSSEKIAPNAAKIQFKTVTVAAQKLKLSDDLLKGALDRKLTFRASTWVIDLNNDGQADIFMLERPLRPGAASAEIVNLRKWFVNIDGQWFKAGELEDADCT